MNYKKKSFKIETEIDVKKVWKCWNRNEINDISTSKLGIDSDPLV